MKQDLIRDACRWVAIANPHLPGGQAKRWAITGQVIKGAGTYNVWNSTNRKLVQVTVGDVFESETGQRFGIPLQQGERLPVKERRSRRERKWYYKGA